jgi:hypothetical protein
MPQLVDVLLSDSVPPLGISGRSCSRNHLEHCVDVILLEERLPPPPARWVGHLELEVWVDLTPSPEINVYVASHHHLRAWVLLESDTKEEVP